MAPLVHFYIDPSPRLSAASKARLRQGLKGNSDTLIRASGIIDLGLLGQLALWEIFDLTRLEFDLATFCPDAANRLDYLTDRLTEAAANLATGLR